MPAHRCLLNVCWAALQSAWPSSSFETFVGVHEHLWTMLSPCPSLGHSLLFQEKKILDLYNQSEPMEPFLFYHVQTSTASVFESLAGPLPVPAEASPLLSLETWGPNTIPPLTYTSSLELRLEVAAWPGAFVSHFLIPKVLSFMLSQCHRSQCKALLSPCFVTGEEARSTQQPGNKMWSWKQEG